MYLALLRNIYIRTDTRVQYVHFNGQSIITTMVELIKALLQVLVALFLVGLNGFFVAAEFAFVRIREPTVEKLAEQGIFGSGVLMEVMDQLDDYLATTQLGITVASIGLGWVGEPAVASILEPVLSQFLSQSTVHIVAFGIAFSLVTYFHVVLGELVPKTLSIQRTSRIAATVAPPMKLFRIVFTPGIYVFNGSANLITSVFGVSPANESDETLDEQELRHAMQESTQQGQVSKDELGMIERVFELDDLLVREVMIPQPDVAMLTSDETLPEISDRVLDNNHTRYPVLEDDHVVGFIDVKDIMRAQNGQLDETEVAADLMSDIPVLPETTKVNNALLTFKDEEVQIGAVVDEWGSFEGIVTVEDLVEVVVGDLRDNFDTGHNEPSISQTNDGEYESDGGVSLAQLNKQLDTEIEVDDVDTVGGLILASTEQIPEPGETVTEQGYEFVVEDIDNNRISRVKIRSDNGDENTATDTDEG